MSNSNVKSQTGKEVKTVSAGKPATSAGKRKASSNRKGGAGKHRELSGQRFNAAEAVMAFGEVFSMEDAIRVASFDLAQGKVSTTPSYAKDNAWQYYIGINTWYLIVADLRRDDDPSGRAARYLVSMIRQKGLVATIALCCDTAQRLVQEQPIPESTKFLCNGDRWVTLQCLRWLKRFTLLSADLINAQNLKSWLRVEKRCKSFNLRNYILNTKYDYVIRIVKDVLAEWLEEYKPVAVDDDLPPVPSGATFEKHKGGKSLTLTERMEQYVRRAHNGRRFYFCSANPKWDTPTEPRYKDACEVSVDWGREEEILIHENAILWDIQPHQVLAGYVVQQDGETKTVAMTRHYGARFPMVRIRHWKVLRDRRFNRLLFVPKNYKSYRSVAPESPVNQMMQRKIRDAIWAALPAWVKKHLPLRDQTIMERLAAAAFKLHLATTDLSHASDSFSVRVLIDAFPDAVRRDVMRWRPTHTMIDGKDEPHQLEQVSTMGTGNVWLLMAVFLLACMVTACELGRVPSGRRNACFVFGDDCIHPCEISEILYWILGLMGFEVNVDKSYGESSRYRESCGSEWWLESDGSVTSLRTLYYPRFPVAKGDKLAGVTRDYNVTADEWECVDGLSRLIAMQHSLWAVAPSAAEFLARAVKRLEPRMTTSVAGTPCDDLWGIVADGPVKTIDSLFEPDERFKTPPTWFDTDLGDTVPVTTRVGHMQLTVVCSEAPLDAISAEWQYLLFLRDGPAQVEDSWFPIGASRRQRLSDPQTLTIKWKLVF